MSAVAELIFNLAQEGVNLRVDGDQLIVRAPKGAVAPETMETLKERKAEVMAELAEPPDVKARRQRVLQMMAEDDRPRTYYFCPDTESHPDYVILACAKRGVGTWEMTIEREKWDAMKFLELVERIQ